ncbi:DUF2958 domain-containing protein [Novosphingobium sp. P6W]|uniref:DUF2958 domain-containing protein n=1 Tax=Novosphingobium sp. P6W TaxID=1609758 RepID=UPI0005C2C1BC|nr:DUF2958 domain-containing protein [Novosphingobium sp. P6W]AXB75897.1 DUF2958 domain-containing protein [Novosphingobium sp. P6W]KIS32905.1 hypothetical protein TQ38_05210 [Novosphingobium sp. P6W]
MILLPPDIRDALRANAIRRAIAARGGTAEPDPVPLLKLFNPIGAATWLASELLEDGDTLFGLADLGFGCPELGTFSLSELAAIRLPYGLGIERDMAFETPHPLSTWADWSRRAGSILWAQALLRRDAPRNEGHGPDPEFPPS